MRISDWSSDVCSSDLDVDWVDLSWGDDSEGGTARISVEVKNGPGALGVLATIIGAQRANIINLRLDTRDTTFHTNTIDLEVHDAAHLMRVLAALRAADRSDEHTSELQSLMRISYDVFCLK